MTEFHSPATAKFAILPANAGTADYQQLLLEAQNELYANFQPGKPVHRLLRQRADFVDRLIGHLWHKCGLTDSGGKICLLGVGGYGRRQLHPHSDIDLLILVDSDFNDVLQERIKNFLAMLWEIKLRIGHSVRPFDECVKLAARDLSVITNLMEAHWVAGSRKLYRQLMAAISPDKMWNSADFFAAKQQEWKQRRRRFADAAWNLEPNIKQSPGGLRELQTLMWIGLRQYGSSRMREYLSHNMMTTAELRSLTRGTSFLWRVRFALHMQCGKCQDRLHFDLQPEIARIFGHENSRHPAVAVEKFMKRYYRCTMRTSMLCELLLSHFQEQVLEPDGRAVTEKIGKHFVVQKNRYLSISRPELFAEYPPALLEIFVKSTHNPNILGISPTSIRAIRENLQLIDDRFRNDPVNTDLFMQLLRSPYKLGRQLDSMWRSGVLEKWLPEFARIRGQMQFDLFHIYPVDAHSIRLVTNLRQFRSGNAPTKLQLPSEVMRHLPHPEILYIAGLYHDIAKGRGGDHSVLGTTDAAAFCLRHQLNSSDTETICWLVRNHLAMSMTAQRRDISDPEVIHEFAAMVGNVLRLDYLYVLTAADISATNPALWDAWRGRLMEDLYRSTRRVLLRGLDVVHDQKTVAHNTREEAMKLLRHRRLSVRAINSLWQKLDDNYFIREQVSNIEWHTAAILNHRDRDKPLVITERGSNPADRRAIKIFVCCRRGRHHFSTIATILDKFNFNVRDASITAATDGWTLDTFYILGNDDSDDSALENLRTQLGLALVTSDHPIRPVQKLTPLRLKHFRIPVAVNLTSDSGRSYSVLEVSAIDRPGLLAQISAIVEQFPVSLTNAHISTLGERASDVFFLNYRQNQQLPRKLGSRIEEAVRSGLLAFDKQHESPAKGRQTVESVN